MKRSFSIFLLFIFLLNVVGYYGIFAGLQAKYTQQLQATFDSDDYARNQEITFKMPITIPYATDSREYTRVDGEFEHEGEVYHLVKQKLQKDTLYIVCVKDNTSRDIKQALVDYVKSFTDKPVNEKGNTSSLQNLIKDYVSTSTEIQTSSLGWGSTFTFGKSFTDLQSRSISYTAPPPRV